MPARAQTPAAYDVAVIGAGVVGAAIARALSHYDLDVVLLEAASDVGAGTSKANTAILHTGFDATPGTLEARLVRRGYALMRAYAAEVGIPLEPTGALLVAWSPEQRAALPGIVATAAANGAGDVAALTAADVYAREPRLGPGALGGVLVPGESIICPYTPPLALATEAVRNGVTLRLESPVTEVAEEGGGHRLACPGGPVRSRVVVNAAGLAADTVDAMLGFRRFTVTPRRGELIVFDKLARPLLSHVLLPVPTATTKGVLVAPTVFGNVLLGPTAEDLDDRTETGTSAAGLGALRAAGARILPALLDAEVTAAYAGLRAATEHRDYQIHLDAARRYVCVGGIRSTGLSASLAIAEHVVELVRATGLALRSRPQGALAGVRMPPIGERQRRPFAAPDLIAADADYGRIVCHCERVTRGELRDALRAGLPARSLDGLRRRTRCLQGRCQGFHCLARVVAMLAAATGCAPEAVLGLAGAGGAMHEAVLGLADAADRGLEAAPGRADAGAAAEPAPGRADAAGATAENVLELAATDATPAAAHRSADAGDEPGPRLGGGGITARPGERPPGAGPPSPAPIRVARPLAGRARGRSGRRELDVVVVGGGPAGLAAALELRRRGVARVLVLDREPALGGVPRHCAHLGFGLRDLRRVLTGPAYARRLVERATRAGVELAAETTAIGWDGPTALATTSPAGVTTLAARAVLLATGCRERPRAARLVAGTRPHGVLTTGALQRLVHERGVRPGTRAVVVGAEHVSFSAAHTLAASGCAVAAVVTDLPAQQSWALLRLAATAPRRVPVLVDARVVEILGRRRVEGVVLAGAGGATERLACDTVVFTGDWIPEHELACQGGVALDPGTRGPRVDLAFRTETPGVFAAGNLLHGAETADVAALEGRAAARAIAAWLAGAPWPEAAVRVPVVAAPPLRWVAPSALVAGGADPPPPRGCFVLRIGEFRRRSTLEVRQGDAILYRARRRRLVPNRSLTLEAGWAAHVRPEGGPVVIVVAP